MVSRNGELVNDVFGPAIEGAGDDFVIKAWEAKTPASRKKWARKALESDLNCIDAYFLLAQAPDTTTGEAIALLKEAVLIGSTLFEPFMDEPDMRWWDFVGTRPFLRSVHMLGITHLEAGEPEEAEIILKWLIMLNPNDNQGVREILVELFMTNDKLEDLGTLLDHYDDDFLISIMMAKLYLDMRNGKPATKLKAQASALEKRNPHIFKHLAGVGRPEQEIETSPYGIAVGSEAEAYEYASRFRPIWAKRKALMNAIVNYVS